MAKSSLVVAALLLSSSLVFAQANAGVADDRLKLPGAPGSIDGVGENATVEGNQGALRTNVDFDVPEGFPGLTPQLSLRYSSSSGSDVAGIGWSFPSFNIERMTSKGLQNYDLDDRFVADGATELVRVAQSGTTATYRARFEGGFVRYTWRDRGIGEGGSWMAEYPDGRIGYFGADAAGTLDPSALVRVGSGPKTFRWHLTSIVDRFGHELRLTWTRDAGGTALLDRAEYLFEAGQPRYSVRLTWETRSDILSDARPGFDLRLTQRLKDVRLFSGAELIRAWTLTYETDADSGGASRLARVNRVGRSTGAYPVVFSFAYSKTLGGACDSTCEKPFVKQMGSLGANFATGAATLIDMNGDALPDVVTANPTTGAHTIFSARLDPDGQVSFNPTGRASSITATVFKLGQPSVQLLDINGDGFMDVTEARTNEVLCNDGSGDWAATTFCRAGGTGVDMSYVTDDADPAQVDPFHVRFFDYDNDKRIDWLRTDSASSATVLVNTAAGPVATPVQAIGYVFDESTLQLADMNGDGLLDPVLFNTGASPVNVTYRLNLGRGQWGTEVNVPITGFSTSQASRAELQDMNGDGLSDVVAVVGNEVFLAINRNGARFDALRTLRTADLASGAIPDTSVSGTVVSYADMNGNGSDDIVFIQAGALSYLELFPVRPNLISRIENGVGAVQRITYGTSIAEQARDVAASKPWANKVPNAMTVVTRTENFVTLTGSDTGGIKEVTSFRYHSGFYDGAEKQFRGYAEVERELQGDLATDAQEPGLFVQTWDVGKTDPVLASTLLTEQIYALAGSNRALVKESRFTVEACPVDGTTGAMPIVSFVCERAVSTVVVERDAAKALTLRTEKDWDGYGNVVRERELGVVNLGPPEAPMACAACTASGVFGEACGAMCLGDERYTERDFITPGTATGGAWIASRVSREAQSAVASSVGTETQYFYDGAAFVGLPLGQLTSGAATRVARRNGPGATDFLDQERFQRDTHGNVVTSLDPTATVADATRGHTTFTFDASGLRVIGQEQRLGGTDVSALRRDVTWDAAFGLIASISNWVPMQGTTAQATAQLTRYRYDEHGRISRVLDPGDSDAAPSIVYAWELGAPSSRVLVTERASASGTSDVVTATCLDGRGRVFQTRRQTAANSWLVDGFNAFDQRGAVVRKYLTYTANTGACEASPPMAVKFFKRTYDVLGRQLTEVAPDGSTQRIEYSPLAVRHFDANDTDTTSAFVNTPTVERTDGLGRMLSVTRLLAPEGMGTPATTSLAWDTFGNPSVVRDAAGNLHTQTFDRLGRLTRVESSDRGVTSLTLDAAGRETRREDAAGNVVRTSYDAIGRRTGQWNEADEAGTRRTFTWDRLAGCIECSNAGGLLVSASWPGGASGGEERSGYDTKGNLAFRQRTLGGVPFITRRTFDGAGRELSVSWPGGLTVTRTWDGAGRVTSVTGVVDSVEYDDRGELATLRFTNGAVTTRTWDDLSRLKSLETRGADGSVLLQLGFTRDLRGDLTSVTDGALAGRVRHGGRFTKDAWSRLLGAELEGETLAWTFDAIDNVRSVTSSLGASSPAHVGDTTLDGTRPHALAGAAGLSFGYDGAGRLSSRGAVTLGRDFLGRVSSAQGGAVDGAFTWGVDARVEEREGDDTTFVVDDEFEVRDGISALYVKVDDQLVARLENDALAANVLSDLASTGSGDGVIDITDAWLAQGAALGVVTLAGGTTPSSVTSLLRSAARRLLMEDATWLHTDHLESVVLATDAAGALRGERSFYPTGTVREEKAFVDQRGFTGQSRDTSSGLLHFAARELDSLTTRWDQPDPAFFSVDSDAMRLSGEVDSSYAYVANGFVDDIDPTGLNKSGSTPWVKAIPTAKGSGSARTATLGSRAPRPEAKSKGATAKTGVRERIGKAVFPFAGRNTRLNERGRKEVNKGNGTKVLIAIAVGVAIIGAIVGGAVAAGLTNDGDNASGGNTPPGGTPTPLNSMFGR